MLESKFTFVEKRLGRVFATNNMSSRKPTGAEMLHHLRMNNYTEMEMSQVKTNVRMCFAINSEKALLAGSFGRRPTFGELSGSDVRKLVSRLPGLRCRPDYTCFNIYPTSQISLDINRILWETIHSGCYDAAKGNEIFGENIFALGVSAELFDFLVHVSEEELEQTINDFLVLLHHQLTTDGDAAGVAKLREELLPQVWACLEENTKHSENGEPKDAGRAATLEHLVQICFMTPWRVDVMAGYLTAQDTSALLASRKRGIVSAIPSLGSGDVGYKGSAMLKMFEDWLIYEDIFCQCLNMPHKAALEAMDRGIYHRRNEMMFKEASTVMDLYGQKSSLFGLLPAGVIERAVVPWIVRRHCESVPPRKRRLATLKSLLELSSRFFEEMNTNGNESDMLINDGINSEASLETVLPRVSSESGWSETRSNDVSSAHASTFNGGCSDECMISTSNGIGNKSRKMGELMQYDGRSSGMDMVQREYPLDVAPPQYSRLERHGGIIDLSSVSNGLTTSSLDAAGGNSSMQAFQNATGYAFIPPESGPGSFSGNTVDVMSAVD